MSIGIALSRPGIAAGDLVDEADQRLIQIKREQRGEAPDDLEHDELGDDEPSR